MQRPGAWPGLGLIYALVVCLHSASAQKLLPRGKLTLRTLRVASTGAEGSMLHFGSGSEYSMGEDSSGNFIIESADHGRFVTLDADQVMRVASPHVEMLSVDAAGGVSVRGVRQWQLAQAEDFSSSGAGWSRQELTRCGGVAMLGGFCRFSRGEVNKTYWGLPPHKQVRVTGTFHFIDRWIGETGYMKLSIGEANAPVVVWSEQHLEQMSKNGISLCGQTGTPEGKFSVPFDVMVSHTTESLAVSFGSTMEDADPCDESWGVSGVELYVRN